MGRAKLVLKRIFCLPPLPALLISVPSFLAVFYVLAAEREGICAYAAYGASAYALALTVASAPRMVRFARRTLENSAMLKRLRNSSFGKCFLTDVMFRTRMSLYLGLLINLLYAVLKLISGIYYRSGWFKILAAYYALLALMRFLLLWRGSNSSARQDFVMELSQYRLCGIVLLFMNQALAGVVVLMVHKNSGFEYPGMLVYVMALYTFYAVITAAMNVVRFRKYGSPVISAAKAVSLTAALVSMLALETAMLAQFGAADDPALRRIMTGITGASVCAVVLGMAVFMIVHSTRRLRRLQSGCQDR